MVIAMDTNFGKNRRGGAAYELLKIDTTGDDDEQASPPITAMEVKLKVNKRRKHKSRSHKSHHNTELAPLAEETTTSLGLVTIQDFVLPRTDGIIAVEPRIHVDFGEAQFQESAQEFQFESTNSADLRSLLTNGSVERPINLDLGLDTSSSTIDGRLRGLSGQSSPVVNSIRGGSGTVFPELRQRTAADRSPDSPVQGNGAEGSSKPTLTKVVSFKKADGDGLEQLSGQKTPPRTSLSSYETPHLTEWERLMAANSEYPTVVDISPINYLRGEVERGSMSERHTSAGIQQRRERIYNTMFHVPWRCELLIDVGFFVCLDSFLSLFTVMPARILMFLWQRIIHWREFQRPHAAELTDFASLVILVLGVAVLQQADISFIYHYIRGQATIKLYVVFNCLEIFDKLCQSFGGDVLQILLNSAVAIGECPPEKLFKQWAQFFLDESIAIASFLVHSLIIMSQAITVSAAINSQSNALLTLLISNNFAEIKSNVFKRVSKENIHKMAYHDTVERFHIMAHLVFVLAQNIQNTEEFWLWSFVSNAGMVLLCEVLVDVIKHSFLAKFNEIKPGAYSEFLQALCKQTLNSQSHEVHKTLHFVPLAPACVVLRVLIPLYATFLPQGPFEQRVAAILILGGGTYIILLALKILVGLGLQMHAAWYLKRCKHKESDRDHPHAD